MNKKLRSLLIAGLLVVGMSGNVFAAGNGNDGCQAPGLRGIHDGNQHKIENVTVDGWKAYMNEFNSANADYRIEAQQKNWEDKAEGPSQGWIEFKIYDKDNKQIEVIHVKFNKPLTDEELDAKNPKPEDPKPPVIPNLPEEEPETGDASVMMFVGGAIASAAGLFMLNKKKDDEE